MTKYGLFYSLSALALCALVAFHLAWGAVRVPVGEVFFILCGGLPTDLAYQDIIWQVRLPRALAGILAGASLAVSGLLMQTFFQNPLAEPSVLGLSSGASLGVALLRLGGVGAYTWLTGAWVMAGAAMVGASTVMLLMLVVSLRVRSATALLLLGLMIGNFAYALISLLQHFSSPDAVIDFWRWSMGSVAGVTWEHLSVFGVLACVSISGAWLLSYTLNGWLLGEQYARSMGIAVGKTRLQIIVLVSLMAGVTTAFCGAVSFIGLAIPAPVRAILRTSRHEILIPAVALMGAVALLFCDALAKLPQQGTSSLPLNVLTALIGSPVIIWVILGTHYRK